jgi:hypothetical protein
MFNRTALSGVKCRLEECVWKVLPDHGQVILERREMSVCWRLHQQRELCEVNLETVDLLVFEAARPDDGGWCEVSLGSAP